MLREEDADLLDARIERDARSARWSRVIPRVAAESARVNRELRGTPIERDAD